MAYTDCLIIDPKGLPPDIAQLLRSVQAAAAVPLEAAGKGAESAPARADAAEFSSFIKSSPQLQQNQAVLSNIATAVSYHQAVDGVLLRLQRTLERMLAVTELAQNPALSAEQRAALTAEFTALHRSLGGFDDGSPRREQSAPSLFEDHFHRFYGQPIETGSQQLLGRAAALEQRQRNRRPSRLSHASFPRITIGILALRRAHLIGQTLDSIGEQHYPAVECVVVHAQNAAIDSTFQGPAVQLLPIAATATFAGVCSALAQRGGEILIFVEAGDIFLPHSLQTIASIFLRHADVEWLGSPEVPLDVLPHDAPDEGARGPGASTRTGAPTLMRTAWRRALWERIESARGSTTSLAEAELLQLFSQLTPLYALNLNLLAVIESQVGMPGSRSAVSVEARPNRQPLELGGNALLPWIAGDAIEAWIPGLERAMREERWADAVQIARRAAAAEPNNPDLLGLEALCEFHLGRTTHAHALLRTVAARFPAELQHRDR